MVTTGLERVLAEPHPRLASGRFGLLMNQASIDRRFRYTCDALAEAYPDRLAALFSPQHGLWGEVQANMVETEHDHHPQLDVPIYSLYSETRRPTAAMLDGLDTVVIDLQDVGTRVYTFIWTVTYVLEACAEHDVPVVLLDRPNPLGGRIVEGPTLDPSCASFVGRAPIPMRHGLTIGELARYLNRSMGLNADLEVVQLSGWDREMMFDQTGLPWVPPSPNLPTLTSALLYPGQVLLEGTTLSEGRGTTVPFEVVGAPGIDPFRLAEAVEALSLPGLVIRPIRFRPTFDKHADKTCGGIHLHVTDPRTFRSYRTTVAILFTIRGLFPNALDWLEPPYEYEYHKPAIDILHGSPALRQSLDDLDSYYSDRNTLKNLIEFDEVDWWANVSETIRYPR